MQSEAKAKALEQFTDYFVKNYPGPDTIIFNPNWHAPKIFAAAYLAITAALSDQEREVEPAAWRWKFDPDGDWHYGGKEPKGFRFGDPELVEALYPSPPLPHREEKDSAEAFEQCATLAEERSAEVRYASWAVALKRLAQEIRALAATHSASASTSTGGRDDG